MGSVVASVVGSVVASVVAWVVACVVACVVGAVVLPVTGAGSLSGRMVAGRSLNRKPSSTIKTKTSTTRIPMRMPLFFFIGVCLFS